MAAPTVYRRGSPRKVTGECNTWCKIWALQVNGMIHQVTMKRQLSQKLVVKYNGRVLLNKRYMFARPAHGYCFVDWASEGVKLEICYQKPSKGIRTNADNYELRVDGRTFVDLPDGCNLTLSQQRRAANAAPKRETYAGNGRSSSSRRFTETEDARGTPTDGRNNDNNTSKQRRNVNGASLVRATSTDFF